MFLGISTHKPPFFHVTNIFSPYRGPLHRLRSRARPNPSPLVRERKGRFFLRFFIPRSFPRYFFCNKIFSKFVKTKKVSICVHAYARAYPDGRTRTIRILCARLERTVRHSQTACAYACAYVFVRTRYFHVEPTKS